MLKRVTLLNNFLRRVTLLNTLLKSVTILNILLKRVTLLNTFLKRITLLVIGEHRDLTKHRYLVVTGEYCDKQHNDLTPTFC